MREQIAQHPRAKQTVKYDKYPEKRFHLNEYGELEEDIPIPPYGPEEADAFYNTRRPSSVVRRYKIPPTAVETRMRVTRHVGPPPIQRASRTTAPQPQGKQEPVPQQSQKRLHWLFYVGAGMLASAVLWMGGSTAFSWLQTQHDNSLYGYPRTYQIDANVGHVGISHFIVENLHGDILVIEVQPSNLTATKVYQGPTFEGAGTDLQPATLSFKDVNGDHLPDMVISVGNGRYVLINTGSSFRPSTPADHIDQQEVQ